MKTTGKVITILNERTVTTTKGEIKKKDFIMEIQKPNLPHPDTIGLTLMGEQIEQYKIQTGEIYTVLYDSDARVSGKGDEVFTKNKIYRLFKDDQVQ